MSKLLVTRSLDDLGLEIQVEVPGHWLEYPLETALFTAGGSLGEEVGTLPPSLHLNIDLVDSAEEAFETLVEGLALLPEAELGERYVGTRGGHPTLALSAAYRNQQSKGVQAEIILAVYVAAPTSVLVRCTGVCGGSAPDPVLNELGSLVNSLQVREFQPVNG